MDGAAGVSFWMTMALLAVSLVTFGGVLGMICTAMVVTRAMSMRLSDFVIFVGSYLGISRKDPPG